MEPVIARLKKGGNNFEILVYPREAIEFKQGKSEISNVLVSEEIYSDAEKGEKVSLSELTKNFGTSNKIEIAKRILIEGEIQIPKELRDELIEKKRKQIASIISRISINPITKAPHPIERILNVMEKKGVNVNYYKKAEDQVNEVINKIKDVLPISIENSRLEIKIPQKYSAASYGRIKSFGKILKEDWGSDGSFLCKLEIPAGIKSEVYNKLNSLTHGEAVIKEIQ